MNGRINHHCSVVEVAGVGVLVEGGSGSGKSSLALGLLERAQTLGKAASLVSDDQALLHNNSHRLIASAPASIAGKVEIRGLGITSQPHLASTRVQIVGRLVDDEAIIRMPHAESCRLHGIQLPLVKLPCRHEAAAIRILLVHIDRLAQRNI